MSFFPWRRRKEEELESEIKGHLDRAIRDRIERGELSEQARENALREFGNLGLVKEVTREMWGWSWLERQMQDVRFGLRMLLKDKRFTLIAVLALALGIGVNVSIFCLVDAALIRPMPGVSAPHRLLKLVRGNGQGPSLSYADFRVLHEQRDVLSSLAISTDTQLGFGDGARSEVVLGSMVSDNYFETLGIRPILGRTFLPEEAQPPNSQQVVVLSYNFWNDRLNGDASVLGKMITLNNRRFTIIGVAPAGFDGDNGPMKARMWIPIFMTMTFVPSANDAADLNNREAETFNALGRLQDGVSAKQAQAALENLNRKLDRDNPLPGSQRPDRVQARALSLSQPRGLFSGALREMATTASRLLTATTLSVLLIACANVANLLLARAATRRKEVAVRLALGATRRRLIQQFLTESVMLALLGAGVGMLLSIWLNRLLMTFKPPFPSAFSFTLDLFVDRRAFVFTFLLALATGALFGLFPALQASMPDLVPALKDETGQDSVRKGRLNLRGVLAITQVALSLALLISMGLFLRSLYYARQIDLGFKPENTLEVSFDMRLQGYSETKGKEFYRQLIPRLEGLPGVQAVSIANMLPLGFWAYRASVAAEGRPIPSNERLGAADFAVGPRYFDALDSPLLYGRDIAAQDNAESPLVAIVSEKLAYKLWPEIKSSAEALGKRLLVGEATPKAYDVIGVVRDSKNNIFNPIDQDAEPTIYRSFAQQYPGRASVLVRVAGDPRGLIPAVRREIAALDANLPAQDLQLLTETTGLATWSVRTSATALSLFGLLGLLVAGVGIYGVMSYTVAQRTHEIGVRMALGAQARDVVSMILKQGMSLVLIGTLLGLALAVAVTRWLASFLLGVKALDPATYAGVALFLICAALLACYLPARRATQIDPLQALRRE
jgi:predicted permease